MISDIPILYEDNDIIVVNKPAGLIVHSDGRTEEFSVADWVAKKYPEARGVGEDWVSPQGENIPRPGIVHRLDRTTSGVMVLAKTQEAFLHLKKQFQTRVIEKTYDALVYGHPKQGGGVIELEIGRTKAKPRRWIAQFAHGKKRSAITEWKVRGRYTDPETKEAIAHLEASPKTGRTHQIRVHLKAIHHPIVCDHLYAGKRPCILGFERPALHARSLTFVLSSGEQKTFETPPPDDFSRALEQLRSR